MLDDVQVADSVIRQAFELQRAHAPSIRKTTAAQRIERLRAILASLLKYQDRIEEALFADMNRPATEARITDIFVSVSAARFAIRNLKKWMKPVKIKTPLLFAGSSNSLIYEPRGACLIISPWNYPFELAIGPLISALAAGNTAIIKPSEHTPETSGLLKEIIAETLDPREATVFEGDYTVAQELLSLPFDHIYFTGSTQVGQIVMEAAAKHSASLTLELGGKSPVVVDTTANIREAAYRVAWGKYLNCGQTCLAPDYVLVHESQKDHFINELNNAVLHYYGDPEKLQATDQYPRIVNANHFNRVKSIVDEAVAEGASIITGGQSDPADNFMSPTLVDEVSLNSRIMNEEIFGPVLPILSYSTVEQALQIINDRPKPLALYIFTRSKAFERRLLRETSSGDAVINDVAVHYGNHHLPFGGVNQSGMGKAHGYYGFKTFSHERSVMKQPRYPGTRLLYPPYTPGIRKIVDLLIRYF